jgi:hypothetical protein
MREVLDLRADYQQHTDSMNDALRAGTALVEWLEATIL